MSSGGKYKAAVIGCGMMGCRYNEQPLYDPHYSHAAAFAAHDMTQLAAVCDADAERAQSAAAKWQATPYTDLATLLATEQPDIVGIATPTETHEDVVLQCLSSPGVRAILCEKPLAADIGQARTLTREAEDKKIPLVVNYMRRFDSGHRKARQLIRDGTLGDIVLARGLFQKGLMHNGTHLIDLYRWCFGEIKAVTVLDNIYLFGFESGFTASLQEVPPTEGVVMDVDIIGTCGRLTFRQGGSLIEFLAKADSPHFPFLQVFGRAETLSEGMRETTLRAIENLIQCLEHPETLPVCSGHDGIRAMEVALAADQAVQSGQTVTLD